MKRFPAAASAAIVFAMISPCLAATPEPSLVTPTTYDNHKGFDFLFGTWTTRYRILRTHLKHDNVWDDCYGTSRIRPFWNGSANLEDGDLHCPPPRGYTESMTLRLYDPATNQWSLYWGTTKIGLGLPQQVGHFDSNGVGQFYADDKWEGTPVIIRYKWWLKSGDHPRFEQAFSTDHGRTWETNWTCDYTRKP
jgi:hypothetical protein